ncbi:hypothetical protein [Vibrio parahaemolyticus]|uniref:hypothetical protein n=1 Tax=Vibrio parahaemolyticus TaxID=670 RepID=UPI00287A13DD|nr:hypothetical protein [Vibrio parahaemolyticus]MDS1910839.1 hypothetical protein [Vibrio parahaemolyticus]
MDNFPLKTRQHTYGLNLWTEKAARPRAEKQQFEYAYLFGSVVAEEELVRLSLSLGLIKTSMIEHLKQILAVTEEGCRAVVVMDGGG